MGKNKEAKQRMEQRVEDIKQFIRFANESYYHYERKTAIGAPITANDLQELINRINYFNKTRYEDVQVGRFEYDPMPVYYFEKFKEAYPKQYKQIVKDMKKEKIAPEYLVAQLPVLTEKLEKLQKEESKLSNKETAKKILKEKTEELQKQSQDMTV